MTNPPRRPSQRRPRIPLAFAALGTLGLIATLALTAPPIAVATADVARPSPPPASLGEPAAERRVDAAATAELLLASGAEAQVRGLSEALVAAAERTGVALSPEAAVRLRDAATTIGAANVLVAAARGRFVRPDDEPDAEAALVFLRSPAGQRIRALEADAEAGIDDRTLDDFIDALFTKAVPLERVHALTRLAVATRGAELAGEVGAVADRTVARAAHGVADDRDDRNALDAELKRIEARRRSTVSMWRAQSTVFMQLVYRHASDEELDAYVAFAESEAGGWLVAATARTLAELEPWLDAQLSEALAHQAE